MECPQCGTTVQIGDRFCEECGTLLVADGSPAKSTGGCAKCGAGKEAIDEEGYCSSCGFRNQMRERDHLEITLPPDLGGVTDRGFRHHQNEDHLALQKVEGKNAEILVVCDGVSSSQSPELASKAAAEAACTTLTTAIQNGVSSETAIKQAIASALEAVCAVAYTQGLDADPPSTTIVAAIVIERTATIGWLGDSRAYWISANGSRQLTRDDSWLEERVASGQMTAAEARKSDKAHAITRWLGADAADNCEPSLINFHIPGAGYLLLCTDGLWNYAPEVEQMDLLIQKIASTEAMEVARYLVEFARNSGGHDNITVAVLRR
jgi:serine/threonine protein phosphatase PrpC